MTDNIFYVYLLKCWKDKKSFDRHRPLYGHIIYCGQTNNIFNRLKEHITGKNHYKGKRPPYTAQFKGNIRLAYLETYETRSEAMKREDEIKDKYSRDKKIELIYNFKEDYSHVLEFVTTNMKKIL